MSDEISVDREKLTTIVRKLLAADEELLQVAAEGGFALTIAMAPAALVLLGVAEELVMLAEQTTETYEEFKEFKKIVENFDVPPQT